MAGSHDYDLKASALWEEARFASEILPAQLISAMAAKLRPDLEFEQFLERITYHIGRGATEREAVHVITEGSEIGQGEPMPNEDRLLQRYLCGSAYVDLFVDEGGGHYTVKIGSRSDDDGDREVLVHIGVDEDYARALYVNCGRVLDSARE